MYFCCLLDRAISIHAPREGSDHDPPLPGAVPPDFYPRSPRGERRNSGTIEGHSSQFLSTLPARGATSGITFGKGGYLISIHAPREGSDIRKAEQLGHFGPISIHAPREGSDGVTA